MRFITHIVLKITLMTLYVVCVFTISGNKSDWDGKLFTVPYAYAGHCTGGMIHNPALAGTRAQATAPCVTQAQADAAAKAKEDTTPISWTDSAFWTSGAFLIYITGIILGFAGWALNGSIHYFVIDMGKTLGSGPSGTPLGNSIVTSWGIIRDIINLTFVFGMIYLAFMTIVRADTSKLKHGVVQIVIAALLINFSLFFAKAIIDFGNVAAIEVYTYMQAVGDPGGTHQGDWASVGISGFFMKQLGLTEFFDAGTVISSGQSPSLAIGRNTGFGFSLLVSLTLLIATFVFFAGAILIAIRFVTLAMLLILSPVAFAGAALPGINTEEWSRAWWKSLVANVLFAPAYFLLLFVSMKAVNVSQMVQGSDGKSGTIVGFFKGDGTAGSIAAFMNFVLVIGFLVGSLIISKRMGAYGASTATAWGKSARMYGQRALGSATLGLGAKVGRGTFGRLGSFGANSDTVKDRASRKGAVGFINRRLLNTSRMAEKASFDARQVGGVGKNLGIGEGKTGGWKKSMEDVAARDKAFAESLGTVDDKDPRVLMFKKQQEDAEHHQHEEEDELKRKKEIFKKWKSAPANQNATPAQIDAQKALVTAQEDIVKAAKKASEAAKETVEHEKNRRILGSAVSKPEVDELILNDVQFGNAKAMLEQRKGALKNAIHDAARATTKNDRDSKLAEIKSLQKDIKTREGEYEQAITKEFRANAVGYAGVLDSYSDESSRGAMLYGAVTSAFAGRTRSMSRASAKGVRDTKIKAKKEEKKAKDDHGTAAPAAAGGGAAAHGHP